jgi:hypothetical protein
MDIFSTNVPGSLEGRGLGKLLADEAFQLAKERGFTIRPSCWYIAGYLRRQEDRSTYLLQFCLGDLFVISWVAWFGSSQIRVFVWFSTLVFPFYKMLFVKRLEFSCFTDFFGRILKPEKSMVFFKIRQ